MLGLGSLVDSGFLISLVPALGRAIPILSRRRLAKGLDQLGPDVIFLVGFSGLCPRLVHEKVLGGTWIGWWIGTAMCLVCSFLLPMYSLTVSRF